MKKSTLSEPDKSQQVVLISKICLLQVFAVIASTSLLHACSEITLQCSFLVDLNLYPAVRYATYKWERRIAISDFFLKWGV